eukprot:scaffold251322_cov23-Tisochrysis_lutea.AAC.2
MRGRVARKYLPGGAQLAPWREDGELAPRRHISRWEGLMRDEFRRPRMGAGKFLGDSTSELLVADLAAIRHPSLLFSLHTTNLPTPTVSLSSRPLSSGGATSVDPPSGSRHDLNRYCCALPEAGAGTVPKVRTHLKDQSSPCPRARRRSGRSLLVFSRWRGAVQSPVLSLQLSLVYISPISPFSLHPFSSSPLSPISHLSPHFNPSLFHPFPFTSFFLPHPFSLHPFTPSPLPPFTSPFDAGLGGSRIKIGGRATSARGRSRAGPARDPPPSRWRLSAGGPPRGAVVRRG